VSVVAVRHAADDRVLVGLLGQQWEQFADSHAVGVGGDRILERAAIVVARLGLGIERVNVARAAPHPDLDDRFGLGRQRRRSRRAGERIGQCKSRRSDNASFKRFSPSNEVCCVLFHLTVSSLFAGWPHRRLAIDLNVYIGIPWY